MSLNKELADLFAQMALLLELRGENPFKVVAYQKISRLLGETNVDLKQHVEQGTLQQLEGIGQSSARIITEYVRTGKSQALEELAAGVPAGLLPLLQIEGLGPKTVRLLWTQANVTSADDLKKAIDSGALAGIKGIGPAKIRLMRKGLEALATAGSTPRRAGLGEVLEPAARLLEQVRAIKGVLRAELAGSLRRRKETIADLDIVAAVSDPKTGQAVSDAFVKLPGVKETIVAGPTKASVRLDIGLQADLRIVPEENFGAALMYFTGSKDHNVKVRGLAQKKGLTLNEWGLYRLEEYARATKKTAEAPPIRPVASRTEEELYRALDLAYIEPEMREDRGEVEAALEGRLPRLITLADIRGDLHTHTTASDGTASIEEMARAALERGYKYLAITDHSPSSAIANGLSVERLKKHIAAIRKAADRIKGIALLAGSEVDILADGRLDYEDAVLAELDIVIASPHTALKQDEKKATDRLLRAIEHRYVNVIGHPTGRLINGRAGLPLDMTRIIKAAADAGTALEINAGWPRLDLNDVNARAAVEGRCMLSINTDAHGTEDLDNMHFGISVARRAWVSAGQVINCKDLAHLRQWLNARR